MRLVSRYLIIAAILLASTPALGFMLIVWSIEFARSDLLVVPRYVSDTFFAFGVFAPFLTPIALLLALVLTFLKMVSVAQKLFCWAVTLGAVASTIVILSTFTRMGK